MYKYYKYAVITLICCISAASFASGNLQKTTNNFNFKNLSAHKNYNALQSSLYDPAEAILACTEIPAGGIWLEDPKKLPSPEPTDSDCEISSQMAYGCVKYYNNTGRALTKSVVGIMTQNPNKTKEWDLSCTGTIIDNQWILTAAHCVVNHANQNLIYADSIIAVTWQGLPPPETFHIPKKLDEDDLVSRYNTIRVWAVYIPKAYTGFIKTAYSPDLALLKINPIRPYMGLEPIPVANTSLLSKAKAPVITAGYGRQQEQDDDGLLRYRKSYYMTNMYDSNWLGGISNNYGNIYILGSAPINYKEVPSAWSLAGQGDGGGPVLSSNSLTGKFQVEGVHSDGLFCNYAGYFAKLPYPYSVAASTTYPQNYNFIKSVMNGTPDPSKVKCKGECFFKTLYVINQISNDINSYKFNHDKSLLLDSKTPTGNYPTQIAFSPEKNTAFVTSFMNNSISQYRVNSEGGLINPQTLSLPTSHNGPIDIAFLSSQYMVVLARNSDSPIDSPHYSLLKYGLRYDGWTDNWDLRETQQTLVNSAHLNVIKINNHTYLLVNNDHEIAVYELDKFKHNLVKTDNKLELTSAMGKLIEIKPSTEYYGKPKLYVLTTNGILIYQLNSINGNLIFSLIGNDFSRHFPPESHLAPLYENSFAISDRYSDNVSLYEVAQDNTIAFKNYISIHEPGEMTFDNDTLYISSFPRSLRSYTISYPNLTVSASYKTVQTGNGPTKVEIHENDFSNL